MRIVLLVGLALSVSAAGSLAAPAPKAAPAKASPLVGDWEPVRGDGPAPPGAPARLTITFTPDGKLRYDQGREDPEWGWYKLDVSKDPPEIDFATPAVAARPNVRKPYLGLYKLDGDVLTIYCAEGARPAGLDAPAGSKVMRTSYRRVKKD